MTGSEVRVIDLETLRSLPRLNQAAILLRIEDGTIKFQEEETGSGKPGNAKSQAVRG